MVRLENNKLRDSVAFVLTFAMCTTNYTIYSIYKITFLFYKVSIIR
jgi:hypothetical protein